MEIQQNKWFRILFLKEAIRKEDFNKVWAVNLDWKKDLSQTKQGNN
jgi:hypothetical protein